MADENKILTLLNSHMLDDVEIGLGLLFRENYNLDLIRSNLDKEKWKDCKPYDEYIVFRNDRKEGSYLINFKSEFSLGKDVSEGYWKRYLYGK